jgi:hypothetical protein
MMAAVSKDPLLAFARLMLTGLLGLAIVAAAAALLSIPILLAGREDIGAEFAANGIDPASIPSIAVLSALGAGIAVLGFFFLRELRRIVDSVADGDPFVPANADRLKVMAWLALAIQVLIIPATGLLIWFDALPQKPNIHYADNTSLGGLVLAILLLVLARVFRVGAAMREELEGTV